MHPDLKIHDPPCSSKQQKYDKYAGAGKHIQELESIRGLAALLVVFFHMPKWSGYHKSLFIQNSYLMVELFFVLSGFVIYQAYHHKINSKKDLLKFQFLRLARLYPTHLLFFILFFLLECSKYIGAEKFGISRANQTPFQNNNLTAGLSHIFLVQGFISDRVLGTFNGPSWSISVEFYTYLLFGVTVLVAQHLKNILIATIAILSLYLLQINSADNWHQLLSCTCGFFIGCVTAQIINKTQLSTPHYTVAAAFLSIVIFLSLKETKDLDWVIYLLSAGLIFALVRSKKGFLNDLLNHKALVWLGSISYSVYMSHLLIILLVNQVLRLVFKKPDIIVGSSRVPDLSVAESIVVQATIIAAVLGLSQIVFVYVESYFRDKSRVFVRQKIT